jgi:methyl-accepting chemotaxis protein
MNTINTCIAYFIPQRAQGMSIAGQRRFRTLIIIQFILLALGVTMMGIFVRLGLYAIIIPSCALLASVATLIVLRVRGSLRLAVIVNMICLNVAVSIGLQNVGGIMARSVWLLAVLPMIPLLLVGRNAGWFWSGVALLILLGFAIAQGSLGVDMHVSLATPWSAFAIQSSLLLVVIALAQLFVGDREFVEYRIRDEQSATQRKVDEAVSRLTVEQEAASARDAANLHASEAQQHYLERSVSTMLAEMTKLAKGDLTVQLSVDGVHSGDNIARLYTGFNEVVITIRGAVSNIDGMVDETAQSTGVIATQADTVRRAMQTQSGKTTDIASAVEAMSTTIRQNAEQASTAAQEAEKAQTDAQQGGLVVGEAISGIQDIAAIVARAAQTIHELGESSEAIGEITKTIEEIADQTNLLALNAAIEAARAGEQGRGFAVVADEVRKLAERTQTATKEIATTIRTIQSQTNTAVREVSSGAAAAEKGQASAAKAQDALSRIIERARRVADIIASVASASEEQSATMDEIARSIDEIKRLTLQASTAMQQTAHSVENLHNLTENLRDLTGRFTLEATPTSRILPRA